MRRPKAKRETAVGDNFRVFTATNSGALEDKVGDFIDTYGQDIQILSMTTTSASYGESNDMGVMLTTAVWYRYV